MSDQDVYPFADPSDVNPFADPSVQSAAGGGQKGLEDYNPFAEQAARSQPVQPAQTTSPTPVYTQPATIEPTRAEPPPTYAAYPGSAEDDLKKRQEELEKKASELEKKENALKSLQQQVQRENNFPPLPAKFCCKPCFYHDISVEIPIEFQRTCKMMYYLWQFYSLTLLFNMLCALALLCVGGANGGETFGVSLVYLVIFIPCSFVFWYQPLYKAFKNDSSFNYMLFFFVFFFQICLAIIYSLGIPGFGTCGWINGAKTLDQNQKTVAGMMFISGAFFLIIAILAIILLKRVHRVYRTTGASIAKAQGEFTRDVISNKNVQSAAAEAAKSGLQAQASRY